MKSLKTLTLGSCAALALVWLLAQDTSGPESNSSNKADSATSQHAHTNPKALGNPQSQDNHVLPEPSHQAAKHAQHQHDIDSLRLQALIDKHVSPEMRREINEALQPGGKPPKAYRHNGSGQWVLDTSDRAGSVMIAIVDEQDELIVTDIMQPLSSDQGQPSISQPTAQQTPDN